MCECVPRFGVVRWTLSGRIIDSGATWSITRSAPKMGGGWTPLYRPEYNQAEWEGRPCIHSVLTAANLTLSPYSPERWR